MDKKLYKSTSDKMLCGVAGGLAEYFKIDSTIVRVLFVVTVFFGGGGVIAYIILCIVVPHKPYEIPGTSSGSQNQTGENENTFTKNSDGSISMDAVQHEHKSIWVGIILILLGGLFLVDNFIPRFSIGDYWPVVLIGLGIELILKAKN